MNKFIKTMIDLFESAFSVLKPQDNGESYSDYFHDLNIELKSNGTSIPAIVVDLDKLDHNICALTNNLKINYRIVAKSLPSPQLLGHIMKNAKTNRLMVFHQPFLSHIVKEFPESDILIGKPLPVRSAQIFYENLGTCDFDCSCQLQWLIDTKERLKDYHKLAISLGIKMRINVEIDIGLHRGGLETTAELPPLIDLILSDPDHLEFSGLMGYDPHIAKVPRIIKSQEKAYEQSQNIYKWFLLFLKEKYPQIDQSKLCLNGAGSPTFNMHKKGTVANDISAGSCLVKPTDFDILSLADFSPASFIATPVLKKIKGARIPSIEFLDGLFCWWNPNKEQSYFIYGGKWMAKFESPGGLQNNSLFGFSTNQEMVNGSFKTALEVNDHIFLRPSQSEFVFLQFGDILAVRDGEIIYKWPILRQDK